MNYPIRLLSIPFLIVSVLTFVGFAYGGVNDESTFVLDFQTTDADHQTVTTLDSAPVFTSIEVNGETRTRFAVTVVLQNATNLTGANCDLLFDNTKIRVVSIHEAQGDINFDGRSNIADVLTLAERYGQATTATGMSYFDLDSTGASAQVIDSQDIAAVTPYINAKSIFWTDNPNSNLETIRESFEIFESPEISNLNGRIDDIVVILLSRIHPTPAGFGFDGDARIADIIFEVVPGASGETTISFEDVMAIDEATEITQSQIINGSTPKSQNVVITLP